MTLAKVEKVAPAAVVAEEVVAEVEETTEA
jgi:hypothetical protein